ncbi:MAG: pantoate--beta-alanine ligase [Planctomycetota bacterium]|jgi:pantoate--beta-alanine ligase
MRVVREITDCRQAVVEARVKHRVGLVPTMGALHDGHMSLVKRARESCGVVAVTIFVNPTQFGPGEDFDAYPRRLQGDLAVCEQQGVDLVFVPTTESIFHDGHATTVSVSRLTANLCGASRPGHFDGVTTIVTKLFNIVPAHAAYFGEKDFQQLAVIRKMVADLNIAIEIIGCPIVREPDGLALSSRNSYLTGDQRSQALRINRALFAACERVRDGEVDAAGLQSFVVDEISQSPDARIDYVQVVDPHDISPLQRIEGPARICVAVHFGSCRLIDNVAVDPGQRPG